MRLVREAVMRGLDGRDDGFQAAVETAVGRILDAVAGGLVTELPGDVSAERCEAILASLEECGLLVRRSKVEEMAEARAMELLVALKAEHGVPG
jgi:hypothetical protein